MGGSRPVPQKYDITTYLGKSVDELRPGMLIYKDVRGDLQEDGTYAGPDGKIDDNDYVRLSDRSNPYHVTFNLGADYKDFSFTAQINASWGGYSFLPSAALTPGDGINSGYQILEYVKIRTLQDAS